MKKMLSQFKSKNSDEIFDVPIDYIKDILKGTDGKHKMLFRVSPNNVALMGTPSKTSMYYAIKNALMSLTNERFSIYVVNKRVDLFECISYMEKSLDLPNPDFAKNIISSNISKFEAIQSGNADNDLGEFKKTNNLYFYILINSKEKNYNNALVDLKSVYDAFSRKLSVSGLSTKLLKEFDTKRLITELTHKESYDDISIDESWRVSDIFPHIYKDDSDDLHLHIEDSYYRHFYISRFPLTVTYFSWLDNFLSFDDDFVVSFHFKPVPFTEEYSKGISNAKKSYSFAASSGKTDADQIKANVQKASIDKNISKLVNAQDRLFEMTTLLQLKATSKPVLKEKIKKFRNECGSGFKLTDIRGENFNPWFASLPIGYYPNIVDNLRWTFTAEDFASTLLFNSSDYIETKGTHWGSNIIPDGSSIRYKGPLIIDKMDRMTNSNGHVAIVATTGAGKSTFLRQFVNDYVPYYDYNHIVDIKGDLYFPYGSRYVFKNKNVCINPFHIYDIENLSPKDLNQAITDVIDDFVEYSYWFSEDMSTRKGNILKQDLKKMFEKIKTVETRIIPTIDDLMDVINDEVKNPDDIENIDERRVRKNFLIDFQDIHTGSLSHFLNGQTNVVFDKFQVFDVSGLKELVFKPLIDILQKSLNNFIRSFGTFNPPTHHLVFDEAHNFASEKNPKSLEYLVERFLKEIRGFGCDVTTATQNFADYLKVSGGERVIGLSHFKIIFQLSNTDVAEIKKLELGLTDAEIDLVRTNENADPSMVSTEFSSDNKGKGILFIGTRKFGIHKILTKDEIEWNLPKDFERIYKQRSIYLDQYIKQGMVVN